MKPYFVLAVVALGPTVDAWTPTAQLRPALAAAAVPRCRAPQAELPPKRTINRWRLLPALFLVPYVAQFLAGDDAPMFLGNYMGDSDASGLGGLLSQGIITTDRAVDAAGTEYGGPQLQATGGLALLAGYVVVSQVARRLWPARGRDEPPPPVPKNGAGEDADGA